MGKPNDKKLGELLSNSPPADVFNLASVLAVAITTRRPTTLTVVDDQSGRRRTFIVTAVEVPNG